MNTWTVTDDLAAIRQRLRAFLSKGGWEVVQESENHLMAERRLEVRAPASPTERQSLKVCWVEHLPGHLEITMEPSFPTSLMFQSLKFFALTFGMGGLAFVFLLLILLAAYGRAIAALIVAVLFTWLPATAVGLWTMVRTPEVLREDVEPLAYIFERDVVGLKSPKPGHDAPRRLVD